MLTTPHLQPRDQRLLGTVVDLCGKSESKAIDIGLFELLDSSALSSRRDLITSLCRLHLSGHVRITFRGTMDRVQIQLTIHDD